MKLFASFKESVPSNRWEQSKIAWQIGYEKSPEIMSSICTIIAVVGLGGIAGWSILPKPSDEYTSNDVQPYNFIDPNGVVFMAAAAPAAFAGSVIEAKADSLIGKLRPVRYLVGTAFKIHSLGCAFI